MSNPGFETTDKAGPPKQPISPVRNIIGVIILIAVVAVGVIQYAQLLGFNAAANKLKTRFEDKNADLMTGPELEQLIGKSPDGPGSDFNDGNATYTKTTYTWPGVLKSYTLRAYYTKQKEPKLHHYETEDSKLETPAAPKPINQMPGKRGGGGGRGGDGSKKGSTDASPSGKSPADASKPADSSKRAGDAKPADGSKPAGDSKPTDGSKPAGDSKPADSSKPAGDSKPADSSKPAGDSKPADSSKPAGDSKPAPNPAPTPPKDGD